MRRKNKWLTMIVVAVVGAAMHKTIGDLVKKIPFVGEMFTSISDNQTK